MHSLTCVLATLTGLGAGGPFALGLACAQDGGKREKPPAERDSSGFETKAIQKTAERVLKNDPPDPRVADKVFRELDRDRSGYLEPAEWTEALGAAAPRVDTDRDVRITPDEYRRYFDDRVVFAVESTPPPKPEKRDRPEPPAAKPAEPAEEPKPIAVRPGKLPAGLPKWFEELDADHDAQVALHEWRRAGRDLAEFRAMDLNGDGLLPPDEYLRHARELRRQDGVTDPTGKR